MGHALRRRRGDRVALAGAPREDDVGHCARGGPVRADGIGAEDGDHVPAAERHGGCQFTVSTGDQTYKQTDRFVYLGRIITADGKVDKETANRICRAWRCFRRHSEAMYDRRRANLWLKVQLLQAEAVETLLYGCAAWSLTADHYTKLNGAHRLFLTRCIG